MREVASASAKALEAAERGLDERTSAFLAFCGKYDVDVQDRRDTRLRLRFGELDPDADPAPEFLTKTAFHVDRCEARRRAVPDGHSRVATARRRPARGGRLETARVAIARPRVGSVPTRGQWRHSLTDR